MKLLWFGLGGVTALTVALSWAERLLAPWMWTFGLSLAHLLAPTVALSGQGDVDWQAVEREVAADVPQESLEHPTLEGPRRVRPNQAKARGGALFVSAERVLELSKHARVPASRYVPASGKRPAGLQVAGVAGLGIGVKDGDVLTRVAGADVRSSAAVISTVLKLRARKATQISGEFWRGQERWNIVFEMPYLEPRQAPAAGSEHRPDSSAPAVSSAATAQQASVPQSSAPQFPAPPKPTK